MKECLPGRGAVQGSSSTAEAAEEPPKILDQQVRCIRGGEVSAERSLDRAIWVTG